MAGLQIFDGSSWRATGVQDSQWDVLTATELPTTVDLSWPTAGGSPSSYELSINDVITNVGNVTSYSKAGLTIGNTYTIKVRPVYSDGSTGGWSYFKNKGPSGFNAASGGTETTVANYNGTGETWKVHTFNSGGTFIVSRSVFPFKVLVVGGGGYGGAGAGYGAYSGGGGGGGGGIRSTESLLTIGSLSVVVGGGGGTSSIYGLTANGGSNGIDAFNGNRGGASGAPTSNPGGGVNIQYYAGGGGGGAGGGGGGGYDFGGGAGGPGLSNNITGTSLTYGAGGRGSDGNGGNGGNGQGMPGSQGGGVIVAYRIG